MKKILIISLLMLNLTFYATNDTVKLDSIINDCKKDKNEYLFKNMSVEDDFKVRHVIKLNLTPIALGNYSFQYECGFHKNFSGALGFSISKVSDYVITLALPPSDDGQGLKNVNMSGWSVTPEFRFYPGKKVKNQAPHGFYIAPYYRYAAYKLNGDFVVNLPDPNNKNKDLPHTANFNLNYSGYSAGLMIGSQWLIGKHFGIDWFIIGAGIGKAQIKADAIQKDYTMSASDQDQVKTELQNQLDAIKIPGFDTKSTITTNSTSAHIVTKGLPMLSIRTFGLNISFYF
jgi:hypothetical protein